ncbi:sialoadhesin-like [Chelmon rostratus]|uniref:sialoadhesin-like n=1 Tax=Chelmon rostratus TaxID=109905 RepID=UPI001BE7244C|nr:sialoadhesin-like [Chelmon rostratus]XP_041788974.1 sialoadhesin-like [Chelmon rostratus]
MSLPAAVIGFVVFLLSMPVVQGQSGWGVTYSSTQVCALEGSTVEIRCNYTYPSTESPTTEVLQTVWFTRKNDDLRTDSEYAGRVWYHCEGNSCTLKITDLRKSDSAKYIFRFITNQPGGSYAGLPGVSLSVTDLQVLQVRPRSSQKGTDLKCHSSCQPDQTSYIWYKNGQKIPGETSSYSGHYRWADSYSCALKGHEDLPSPSKCVSGQSCNRVTCPHRSICAFKGSSVDISCTYSSNGYYVDSKFWFSPERSGHWLNPSQPEDLRGDSQYKGRVQVITERGRSTLRITDLTESDSAQYHFKFRTGSFEWTSSLPGTTLTVTDPDLQVLIRKYSNSWSKLTCHSSCHLPHHSSYIWYKNGKNIWGQTSNSYSDYFDSASSYSCAVRGSEDFPSPPVCVSGQSCYRVTYPHRSICAAKGSSVDISCTYSSYGYYAVSKFWFSPERSRQWLNPSQPEDLTGDSQYKGHVQVISERGRSTLRITDLTESDSVQYRFKFRTGSFEWTSSLPGTTLTVTALQVQVTRIKVHQFYTEAELKCHSSCGPAGRSSYVWFKNGEEIMTEESSSYEDQFYPGDIISCALKGHEAYSSPSVYALNFPSVSVSPSGEIVEGSSVTLTCSSDANPAANYTWYKENVNLKSLSEEAQLVLTSIQSSDSGEYYCAAENELGRRTSQYISINVKYAPKTSSVSVSPSGEIVEGSSVNLTCSSDANPAANYAWYRGNQTLIQGPQGRYHFTSITSKDRGSYSCKSKNQHGQLGPKSVFIDVQYAPKLPSVSLSPSGEIVEGSSVNLSCSSDANPAANYTWYKENEDSPKASGEIFTITDFRAEHSGNYYCEAQNRRGHHNSTLHLLVVAGAWKATAGGISTAGALAVTLLLAFLIRRKRVSKQSSEPGERPGNREERQPEDQQDDLHYASVHFSKKHSDPLYSNIRPKDEEEDIVVYTAIRFKSGNTATRDQTSAEEDSTALYSTINKTC